MINSISKSKSLNSDFILIAFIGCYFLMQSINLLLKVAVGEPQWWHLSSRLILAILLGLVIIVIICKNAMLLFVEGAMAFLILIPVVFNTLSYNYSELETTIFNFYLVYLPLGLSLYLVRDMSRGLKNLYGFAWISEIILFATVGIAFLKKSFISSEEGNGTYNMAIGYSLLINSLLILDHFFDTKRLVDLGAVLVGVVLTILFSSRTPLLCLAVFVLLRIFKSSTIKKKTKQRLLGLLVLLLVAIIIFYSFFAKTLYEYLFSIGYESTSLRKLLLEPLDDSHRTTIYSSYFNSILQNPIFGYGILGGWHLQTYPHNIFIEIWLSFGILIGTIIIICGAVLIYKGARCRDQYLFRMFCILLAYNFHLILSSSFLKSITFCMLVAISIRCFQHSHKPFKVSEKFKQQSLLAQSINK